MIRKLMEQAHAAGYREGFLTAALLSALVALFLHYRNRRG